MAKRLLLGVALLMAATSACGVVSCDCFGAPIVGTITGQLESISPIQAPDPRPFMYEQRHDLVIRTPDATVNLIVTGQGDILIEGESYELEVFRFDGVEEVEGGSVSLFSDQCCTRATTILGVDADGATFEIENPPWYSVDITSRQVFVGFGIFVLVTAVLGRSRG